MIIIVFQIQTWIDHCTKITANSNCPIRQGDHHSGCTPECTLTLFQESVAALRPLYSFGELALTWDIQALAQYSPQGARWLQFMLLCLACCQMLEEILTSVPVPFTVEL
jgi:hypothetical protein